MECLSRSNGKESNGRKLEEGSEGEEEEEAKRSDDGEEEKEEEEEAEAEDEDGDDETRNWGIAGGGPWRQRVAGAGTTWGRMEKSGACWR